MYQSNSEKKSTKLKYIDIAYSLRSITEVTACTIFKQNQHSLLIVVNNVLMYVGNSSYTNNDWRHIANNFIIIGTCQALTLFKSTNLPIACVCFE